MALKVVLYDPKFDRRVRFRAVKSFSLATTWPQTLAITASALLTLIVLILALSPV